MMEFQQNVHHAFMLGDANGACAKCSKDSKDVMKLVEKGCSLDEASTVAQGSICDSILVWAASGLSKPEQQREPARVSTTKLAISSIIDCVRTWKDKPSFLACDVFNQEMEDLALLVDKQADPVKQHELIERYDRHREAGLQTGQPIFPPLEIYAPRPGPLL